MARRAGGNRRRDKRRNEGCNEGCNEGDNNNSLRPGQRAAGRDQQGATRAGVWPGWPWMVRAWPFSRDRVTLKSILFV